MRLRESSSVIWGPSSNCSCPQKARNAAAYSAQWKVYMARILGSVIYSIDTKSSAIIRVHNIHILGQIGKEM